MGCSFSGLNALYDASNRDVWINENRFKILRPLDGGLAYVFLVKARSGLASNKSVDPSHISDEGTYAMKKILIQSEEQLELVKEEIHVSSLFSHPNLLPLLDHAIIAVKEWAAEHSSEPCQAPELCDCPSHADIDERTDIWSLGCTLYAIMYGESPFEYDRDESGGPCS